MNKTKLTVSAVAGVALVSYYYKHFSIIQQRFPHLEKKVAWKAYNTMMRRALSGKYADTDDSEETNDRIFLAIVQEQTASK